MIPHLCSSAMIPWKTFSGKIRNIYPMPINFNVEDVVEATASWPGSQDVDIKFFLEGSASPSFRSTSSSNPEVMSPETITQAGRYYAYLYSFEAEPAPTTFTV